jgi:hypothetical protein
MEEFKKGGSEAGTVVRPSPEWLSWVDRFADWMQASAGFLVILVAWVYVVATAMRAQHFAFWYDELLTVYICRLPRLADVWHALRAGLDLNPPFQYVAVRAAQSVFGQGQLATRLPVLTAFLAMSLFLFLYLRRRVHVGWALTAMLFPWMTDAYRFAMDARPYGIVLGAAGAALYFWSRATESDRPIWAPVGLGLSLMVALATHCYGVMLAVPLAAGEAVRLWRRRRPDWLLWSSMAVGAWPIVMYPALMAANPASPVQKSSPFHVSLWTAPETYNELLQPAFWVLLFVLAISLAGPRREAREKSSVPFHELAVLMGFAAIPLFAVALSAITTGTYSLRYGVPGVIGIAGLLAWACARMSANPARSGAISALVLMAVFTGQFAKQLWSATRQESPRREVVRVTSPPPAETLGDVAGYPLLSLASGSNLPIAVADGLAFLTLDYYGNDALRARSFYLMDPQAAMRRTGSAWFDTTYPTAKRMLQIRSNIELADQFLARKQSFLVYSTGRVVEWLIPELLARGWHLRVLGKNATVMMLEATPAEDESVGVP